MKPTREPYPHEIIWLSGYKKKVFVYDEDTGEIVSSIYNRSYKRTYLMIKCQKCGKVEERWHAKNRKFCSRLCATYGRIGATYNSKLKKYWWSKS